MNRLRIIIAIIGLSLLTGCGMAGLSQNTENHTDKQIPEIESFSQPENFDDAPQIDVEKPFTEADKYLPLKQPPYGSIDVSEVKNYFVHDELGTILDMNIYIELIDKETDALYFTVKNNKNVWREAEAKVYQEYDRSVDISTAECFAVAPNSEVVVKLTLNAGDYDNIYDLGFSFSCNGQNYSETNQTAYYKDIEPAEDRSFDLELWRHDAVLLGHEESVCYNLSENIVRGFTTFFTNYDSDSN